MFESKHILIYYMKISSSMNPIHDNEVNNIAEWNLLHDMINPSKRTKNINSNYSHILNGCMNICKGKSKVNNF